MNQLAYDDIYYRKENKTENSEIEIEKIRGKIQQENVDSNQIAILNNISTGTVKHNIPNIPNISNKREVSNER